LNKKIYDLECTIEKILHDFETVTDTKIINVEHNIAECNNKRSHLISIDINYNMD
jgi:hypothetical protein